MNLIISFWLFCGLMTWTIMVIKKGFKAFWEFDWMAKWILFFTGPIGLIVFLEKD